MKGMEKAGRRRHPSNVVALVLMAAGWIALLLGGSWQLVIGLCILAVLVGIAGVVRGRKP